MLHNFLLPLITLMSGLLSLYIDPKKDKTKAWIIGLVLVISASATGTSGFLDDKSKEKEKTAQLAQNQALHETLTELKSMIASLIPNFGLSDTNGTVQDTTKLQTSMAANNARNQVLHQMTSSKPRTETGTPTIQYFLKGVDGPVVAKALGEGGFKFSELSARTDVPTNAIWVGDSVSVEDLKFVALTLIRAGVKLRGIRSFKVPTASNSRAIQIGGNEAWVNSPVLTVDAIQGMTASPPRDETP